MEKTFEQELNARASAGEEHVSFEADATQLAVPKANVLKFDHDMVTDEVVVSKDEEVSKTIDEVSKAIEESGITFAETSFTYPQDGSRVDLRGMKLMQQSIATLKELTNNTEVQKALESEGLTVDVKAILNDYMEAANWPTGDNDIIRPLSEVTVACACDTCLEENADALTLGSEDNVSTDADIDLGLIVADLSERLAKLEQRIVEYNVRSSHKI